MQTEAVYQTLFWTGAIGVAVMGAMGAASHGGHGGHGHDAHGGSPVGHHHDAGVHHGAHHHGMPHHGVTHGHAPAHGHSSGATHHAHHEMGASHGVGVMTALLGVLSPMTLFAVSLGAGVTGLALGTRFPVLLTAFIALLGGLAMFALVVRPLMDFARRFVSKPARTLAGVVATEAVAQNRFDADGRGIVSVTLDGQIVRLLAHLERDDHAGGVTVAPGEALLVTQIDEAQNSCRVTKL